MEACIERCRRRRRPRAAALGFVTLACLAPAGCSAPAGPSTEDFGDLVAAERAFAATSRALGMNEAFLEFLAADSIVFRPGPVDGRQAFQGPPPAGTLDWYPARAEVAASGDLGYTTGPWEYGTAGSESGFGHYVSVWRRRDDGAWRVALDIGIGHPRPEGWDPAAAPRNSRAGPTVGRGKGDRREALLAADRDLLRRLRVDGADAAYRAVAADDLTLYRNGGLPAEGAEALAMLVGTRNRVTDGVALDAGLSGAGDLGYTYGTLRVTTDGGAAQRSYARIWRRQGADLRLVIDVELPDPSG